MKRHVLALLVFAITIPLAADMQVVPHAQEVFKLTPSAPSVIRPLLLDAAPRIHMTVTALHKDLTVALISPLGTRFTIGTTAPNFLSSILAYDTPPGANYHASLMNPIAGTWQLQVAAPSVVSELEVAVNVITGNDNAIALIGGGQTAPAGSSTPIALAAFDGTTRLRAITVTARAYAPDGTSAPIAFHDDGASPDVAANDGVFTANLFTALPGEHEVSVEVRGNASTGAFRRTANATVIAVPRTASLDGTFIDSTVDDNGDALADAIVIAPRLMISEAGTYLVSLRLASASGRSVQRSASVTRPVGTTTIPIPFDAETIQRDLGENGPYAVSLVEVESTLGLVDRRINLGTTQPWPLASLQHDRLRVAGSGTATPVDLDANGKYDQLKIALSLHTEVAGSFTWSGTLTARNGATLGVSGGSGALPIGTSTLDFTFAGLPIGQNGFDGPYDLSILAFGAGQSLVATKAFETAPYRVWQFEGGVQRDTTPPALVVSVTPSVLWPVNHRMIEIVPAIDVRDDFDATPTVVLDSIVSNEGQEARGDGRTSADIEIDATGRIFLRAERSGIGRDRVYTLTWSAHDDAGNRSTASATVTVPHDRRK